MKQLTNNFRVLISIAAFVFTVSAVGCGNTSKNKTVTTVDSTTVVKDSTLKDSLPPIDSTATQRPETSKSGGMQKTAQ